MSDPPAVDPFDDVSLELLRARRSAKWTKYPADVLPAWVAETDFALALPIREVLQTAVARDDTGYPDIGRLPEAFAAFAASRFGWRVEPENVRLVADVMSAVEALLRLATGPGDAVVVNPPVYPPFFSVTRVVGRSVVEAPLATDSSLDLDAIESAFAAGARAYLLCNPHNPTGRPCTRAELEQIAALAARYGVTVISDEVHAPMTLPGATHVPYLSVGEEACAHGVVVTSASKTWNLAGLKCAVIVSASKSMDERLTEGLPMHLPYHAGHFGVLAGIAAFAHGSEWLDALIVHLDRNRTLLGRLLDEQLPGVRYTPPQAGYLAWLDCRALGLSDDPAVEFLERGRVALSPGPSFGKEGNGFARLNIGTSSALVEEAVSRMAAAVA
ncbi:MAG TPA: aminotransferase class I/II-fold pyridoxal phosphate-dependent enzyme [Gaiellaceae bacterium]|nr:aminotransferase class I/II-fold pyridoxal phosphate-dependent enzyme [Gaiellaceae bacterium]